MSIDSTLKKEGIIVLSELDTLEVNTIARNVASKLCLALPEHNFNMAELFTAFSRINMYIAQMPVDLSGAKYFYKNNSIYFNLSLTIEEMSDMAVHECIHFIQEERDENSKLKNMGLYNLSTGLAINEAAVQLIASEANNADIQEEKYYNIALKTISPNYYPLECAIVNQMAYFTGTYPLYHSTINSNDVFKNTFILKSDKRTYEIVVRNLDKLLALESELNFFISESQDTDKVRELKLLTKLIDLKKKAITLLFFKTQNLIIKKCFSNEFNNIRTIKDARILQKRIYKFKELIGYTENYTFYNDFYCEMMNLISQKKEDIKKYGEINLFEQSTQALTIIDETKSSFAFIKIAISKIKKLFKTNQQEDYNQI